MPLDPAAPGGKFGRYELVRRIGVGGMAEVFLARQDGAAGFEKLVVIKRFLEMFLDEARLAARLAHPNICTVFDLGEAEGGYYLAMEYVPGVSLYRVLRTLERDGRDLPLPAALRIVTQLLEALDYAHALADEAGRPLDIVHRDVTPTNIMVTPQGGVKLLDFGIARAAVRQHHTQAGLTKGQLGFMAPEQLRATKIDRRADLFSAGTVLYLLAAGQPPYGSDPHSDASLRDMVEARFPRPCDARPDLPEELERIILKAMQARPADRYATASEMHRDLERFASSAGLSLGPHPVVELMASLGENAAPPDEVTTDHDAPAFPETTTSGHAVAVSAADILGPPTAACPPPTGERPSRAPRPLAIIAVLGVSAVAGFLAVVFLLPVFSRARTAPPAGPAIATVAPAGGHSAGRPVTPAAAVPPTSPGAATTPVTEAAGALPPVPDAVAKQPATAAADPASSPEPAMPRPPAPAPARGPTRATLLARIERLEVRLTEKENAAGRPDKVVRQFLAGAKADAQTAATPEQRRELTAFLDDLEAQLDRGR